MYRSAFSDREEQYHELGSTPAFWFDLYKHPRR